MADLNDTTGSHYASRFGLKYIDQDGSEKTPVMIHRALVGSPERFLGILIEHYAGSFPVWLAPVQVTVLPLSEKILDYGNKVFSLLKDKGARAEFSDANESLAKRIRAAEVMKIPYIIVVGEKEAAAGTVAVRSRKDGTQVVITLDEFIEKIKREIKDRIS